MSSSSWHLIDVERFRIVSTLGLWRLIWFGSISVIWSSEGRLGWTFESWSFKTLLGSCNWDLKWIYVFRKNIKSGDNLSGFFFELIQNHYHWLLSRCVAVMVVVLSLGFTWLIISRLGSPKLYNKAFKNILDTFQRFISPVKPFCWTWKKQKIFFFILFLYVSMQ